jgi:hypothetical protein
MLELGIDAAWCLVAVLLTTTALALALFVGGREAARCTHSESSDEAFEEDASSISDRVRSHAWRSTAHPSISIRVPTQGEYDLRTVMDVDSSLNREEILARFADAAFWATIDPDVASVCPRGGTRLSDDGAVEGDYLITSRKIPIVGTRTFDATISLDLVGFRVCVRTWDDALTVTVRVSESTETPGHWTIERVTHTDLRLSSFVRRVLPLRQHLFAAEVTKFKRVRAAFPAATATATPQDLIHREYCEMSDANSWHVVRRVRGKAILLEHSMNSDGPNASQYAFKCIAFAKAPFDACTRLLWKPDARFLYDERLVTIEVIEESAACDRRLYLLTHRYHQCLVRLVQRTCVRMSRIAGEVAGERCLWVVGKTEPTEHVADPTNHVHMVGWQCSEIDANTTMIQYMLHVDLRGSIPYRLVKPILIAQMMSAQRYAAICGENGADVRSSSIPRTMSLGSWRR